MKIVVGGVFPPGATELFSKEFIDCKDVEIITDLKTLEEKNDIEILVTRGFKVTADFINKNKNLKFIQKWGTGLNTIDIEAAGEKGIPVSNVPGANAYAVAELTIMLMLAVYRNLLYHNSQLKAGIWSKTERIEQTYCLKGKKIGIIGSGNVGKAVAKRVQAFEAETVYYDVFRLKPEEERELHLKYVPIEELLSTCDVITLHIPLLDSTKNFITKKQFSMMKKNAILINASRGGLVNEADLLETLNAGTIMGAGLDCFSCEKEMLTQEYPLLHCNKITMTPHVGGTSNDLLCEMVPRMAKNTIRFLNGEKPISIANKEYLVENK